jgi:hypothetical protein
MSRGSALLPALLAVSVIAALPLVARAQAPAGSPPAADGYVASDEVRVDVLAAPARVGERIERPEGWYRVEESGPEDGQAGSFGVVPAARFEPAGEGDAGGVERIPAPFDPMGTGPAYALADPCRAERTAYLRELLATEGIELDDPAGLMEGLEGDVFAPGFSWFWLALRVDPIRPLAWNSELRALAKQLARCASGSTRSP